MNIPHKLRAISLEVLLLAVTLAFVLVPAAWATGPRTLEADMTELELVEGFDAQEVTITVDTAPTEAIPLTAVYSASQVTVMTGTIAAGETSTTVSIAANDDGIFEGTVTDTVLFGAEGQNTVTIEVTIRDNLLENGSFETLGDDSVWEVVGDGGRFDRLLPLPNRSTDGDNVAVFDRNDRRPRAIGVRQTIPMPESLSGSEGDEIVLTFDAGFRRREGGIVGARVTLLSGDDVIQRNAVLIDGRQGPAFDQILPLTASQAYDAITVELGGLREFTGDFGFDNVVLSINETYTIEELILANDFSTLEQALDTAGLDDTFDEDDDGPYTVLAPTDEAFDALVTDLGITEDDLLARMDLADILQYHIVNGTIRFQDVLARGDGATSPTLEGSSIEVDITESGVFIIDGSTLTTETAEITFTNIIASNGVIHLLDYVLAP